MKFTFVGHPQANGQLENANRILQKALKKKIREPEGKWAEELPYFMWAYQMTFCTLTGHTPFELTYGVKTRLAIKVDHPTARELNIQPELNEQLILEQLDEI